MLCRADTVRRPYKTESIFQRHIKIISRNFILRIGRDIWRKRTVQYYDFDAAEASDISKHNSGKRQIISVFALDIAIFFSYLRFLLHRQRRKIGRLRFFDLPEASANLYGSRLSNCSII